MPMKSGSRVLFIAELLLLALPVSLLDVVAMGLDVYELVSPTKWYPRWAAVGMVVVASLATISLISGWILSIRFLRRGSQALSNSHWSLWLFCALGGLLAFAALVSSAFPIEGWSELWHFRNDCKPLALGLLLLIPFTHLLVERFRFGR